MGSSSTANQNIPAFNAWHEQQYQQAQHQRAPMQATNKGQQDRQAQTFGQKAKQVDYTNMPAFNSMNMAQSQYQPQQHMGNMSFSSSQQSHQMHPQSGNNPNMSQMSAPQGSVGQFFDQNQNRHVNSFGPQSCQEQYKNVVSHAPQMDGSLTAGDRSTQAQSRYNSSTNTYHSASLHSASTAASSSAGYRSSKSLYALFHDGQRLNKGIHENLDCLSDYYREKPCSNCGSMVGRYNLQYHFDSGILAKPQSSVDLSNILATYCDHTFCLDCFAHGIKERAVRLMEQTQKVSYDEFRCPLQCVNEHGQWQRCNRLIPQRLVQHFLDGLLYKSTTQQLNKYHAQVQHIEAAKNNEEATDYAKFNPQKPAAEACKKCGVIHCANQGVFCETITQWRRVHRFSEAKKHLDEVVIPPTTEVLGHVIVDKATISFFKSPEMLAQLGRLGIYPYEQKVDRAQWYMQKQYLHSIDRQDFNKVSRDQYEPLSEQETIKVEWNYGSMVRAIQKKDHVDLSETQNRNLLQWRQKLDSGLECEFMMFDNNPGVDNIYLRGAQQSLWILREVKDASRPIRKIYRESKDGRRHNVLVLVGTKPNFDELQKTLSQEHKF